jgi:hypothetical protein
MYNRAITVFVTIFLAYTTNFAQTVSIDLDNEAGIQSKVTSRDTSATIAIAIRLTGVNQISSYQFKVSFDTTKFTFIGAQQDFGTINEKNILVKNGGSIIGIAQLQLNPPAKDTVEFSFTITGTTPSTLVSGDGLAGVLYLKSKVPMGDSTAVTVSNCILADFELNQTTVNVYNKGTYSVLPVTRNLRGKHNNISISEPVSSVSLSILNRNVQFDIPSPVAAGCKMVSFTLYTIDGKFLTAYQTAATTNNVYIFGIEGKKLVNQFGNYLCCLKMGSRSYTQILSFN